MRTPGARTTNAPVEDVDAEGMHRIDCGEATLECKIAGPHGAPLVVLLHGFPESWYAWRHQIRALSASYRVVAPNLRGYGRSDRPLDVASYRLDRLANDVAGLIRGVGYESAHVVGHDWGGAVAWALAIDREYLVDKLVVCNCPHPASFERAIRRNPTQLLRSSYFLAFLLPLAPERLLSTGDHALLRGLFRFALAGKDPAAVLGDEYLAAIRGGGCDGLGLNGPINYYRAAVLHADELRRYVQAPPIRRPTLVIWGEDDPALGIELTEGLGKHVAGRFRLETLPGCSHWVQQEKPEVVTPLLAEFLSA